MTDDHVLIEADREVRAALLLAGADDGSATNGRYNLVLTLAELRVVHTAIAAQLAQRHDVLPPLSEEYPGIEPDVHSKTTFWPETQEEVLPAARPFAEPSREVWSHSLVVKDAAAVPGVQALLFLYLGVGAEIDVSPEYDHWRLTWKDSEKQYDFDFLRPHILPPKPASVVR